MSGMDDGEGEQAEEQRRARKLAARIRNDRLKSLAAIGQGTVLVLIGVGALRFLLDPAAPDIGLGQISLTMLGAIALELAVLYILGMQRPED